MKLPLADLCVVVAFSSLDVKSLSGCKGFDVASFSCPLSLLDRSDLEVTGIVLSRICLDNSSVFVTFSLDTQSEVSHKVDKGISSVIEVDMEDLIWGSFVVLDGEFVGFFLEGEGFVTVDDADDLVGTVRVRLEHELLSLH